VNMVPREDWKMSSGSGRGGLVRRREGSIAGFQHREGVVSAEFGDWEMASWTERCGEYCWSMDVATSARSYRRYLRRTAEFWIASVFDTRNITTSPTFLVEIFFMRAHQGEMKIT